MGQRPNFLLFITDQQRYDHLGCMGDPLLQTPHVDKLAAEGTIINRFYVASPACQPNRASLMTGRMPSLHGVRHNGIPLDLHATTFVHQLQDAGYKTALIGKSHLQNFLDMEAAYPPPSTPPGYEPPTEDHAEARCKTGDESLYLNEVGRSWRDPNFDIMQPYYGFAEVRLCTGHGDKVGGHYRRWFAANCTDESQQPGLDHALAQAEFGSPQTYQTAVPPHLHPTAYVAQETISYLDEYAAGDQADPFFIQCAFPDPHHPFAPPGPYWDMYDPHDVTLPRSFYESNRDQLPPLAHIQRQRQEGYPRRWTAPFMAEEMPAKEMVAKNYGLISFVDDAVGQVMAQLTALGLENNTVICFMSDHGDWMGTHGLFLKGPLHYQGLVRVPFIWRDPDPQYNSGALDAIGSTLDFGATILHRAQIMPFNGNQGHNLLPLLAGDANAGHENVLIEQATQYIYLGFDRLIHVTSLISQKWRLTVWEGEDWGELYDLENDPEELENLWHQPAYAAQKSHLLLQMVHRIQSLNDNSPYPSARA